jgi:hypothetical protein
VFKSQGEAKRFFVDRIVAQARAEGRPLSALEQWMLSFSESDPEFVVDPGRVTQLETEISDEDYEAKIAGLIRRRYERDADSDPGARATYRDAYAALGRGDHYLLVMIDQALGSSVNAGLGLTGPLRMLSKAGLFVLLVLPGSFAVLLAVGVAWGVVSGHADSPAQAAVLVLASLLFGGMGYYLIRLWRREAQA